MFLVLYGLVAMATPVTAHECTNENLAQQPEATHSCCNQQASHRNCCPDHQCKIRTDDNVVEIVAYKELNPQFQLFDFLNNSAQVDQIVSESSLWDKVVSFRLHKLRIHLYNRVLRI